VVKMEPMIEMGMELRHDWRKKRMGITVLMPDSKLYRIYDSNGNPARLPEQGILLPEKLRRILKIEDGDQAVFRILWPGKRSVEDEKKVMIKGKVLQYVGQTAYGSMEQADHFFGEGPVANVVLLKLENTRYEKEILKKLRDMSGIGSIQSKAESIYSLEKALETFNSMVGVFILAAGLLAFAVIYNITNINIYERRRELATLKVLGFTDGEMKQLVFNENFVVTFMGVLAGLPVGRIFLNLLMESATTDNMTLPVALFNSSYLWAFCLMFGFTILANLVLTRKIRVINMVEALKSNE
ncbi:MAG: ABC transporter permease, partial [Bacteroidota bacterium]